MEITTKQRSALRSAANRLELLVHIGKSGLTPTVINEINVGLFNNELIKINVLKNSAESAKELSEKMKTAVPCCVVQVIGNKIVVYRESDKENIVHILE